MFAVSQFRGQFLVIDYQSPRTGPFDWSLLIDHGFLFSIIFQNNYSYFKENMVKYSYTRRKGVIMC